MPDRPQTAYDMRDTEIRRLREALADAQRFERAALVTLDLLTAVDVPPEIREAAWTLMHYLTERASRARGDGLRESAVPDPRTTPPTADELQRFLAVFECLNGFEASQRSIRGHGAFDPATEAMPDPAVIRTLAWIKERAGV